MKLINKANTKVSFGGATVLLIVVALLGQGLGFLRNRLVSTNFTSVDPGSTDAFFAAFQIPDFFFLTIAAGALGVAFVPVLADRLHAGDRKGMMEITNSLLNLLGVIMFVVAIIIFIFARPLLQNIVAPNLTPHQLDQATSIMRLAALNPMFFTLSGIITSLQQTYGRFFFYAIAPLFYNLAIIFSVYLFKDQFGVVGLGIGALIGAILQLLVAILGLWGLNYRYRPQINFKTADFRQVMKALPARSVDQGIDSINSIVETNRANMLGPGPVSYYNFATTLQNVPIMLFGNAIATAAFPKLAERLSQKRPDLFHKDFFRILRLMIWIAMPVVVVSYFCRGYLARLLFGDVAPEVALIFGYLTVAIFFRIVYSIASRYFYAQKDTRTPLLISLFAIGLNIVLVFDLARPSSYGIAGLALAQSLTAAIEVVLLFVIMFLRDRYLLNRAFWGSIVRIVSVTGFSMITAFIMVSLLPLQTSDRGFVTLGFKFGAIAGMTVAVHICMSLLFGLDEPRPVLRRIGQLILKPINIKY
ncbi:MAG: MATE family efflux transporter [Candidatus Saccharibacteria bacterium]|nr:MATE family efflux transporter [Candidatus Saccharibacteria bacterium]